MQSTITDEVLSDGHKKLIRQHHEAECTLFQLKKLEVIIDDPISTVFDIRSAREQKGAILDAVKMPAGIPVAVFKTLDAECAAVFAAMAKRLEDGTLVLS